MKTAVLTGIATEHHFTGKPENLGKAQFYLVFNEGELRIPVSQEAASVVVKHYAKELAQHEAPEEETESAADGEPQVQSYATDDDDGADEDGVASI